MSGSKTGRVFAALTCTVAAVAILPAIPPRAAEIDELRDQMRTLMRRIDDLEAQQRRAEQQKLTAPPPSPAAPVVTPGSERVKLSISGQVNRAGLYVNDGDRDGVFHVDNDFSSTRVRFLGTGQVTDDFTVGAQIEVQMESNSSFGGVNSGSLNGDGNQGVSF